jgi:hypothetical protein
MAFNLLGGCKSMIWDPKEVSAYDLFDTVKPDVFITHISGVTTDAVSYLKENKHIQMIVNITGGNAAAVSSLEQIFLEAKLNCPFFFLNGDSATESKKIKVLNLGFGSDVFLNEGSLKYNIENGIFVSDYNEIKSIGNTYHTKNYNNFIFRSGFEFIPQVLLDAIFYGNRVWFDIDSEEERKIVSDKIKKSFRTDMDITDPSGIDPTQLKKCVIKRHTCLHKAKSLLSQFSCKDQLGELDKLIELYTKDKV